MPLRASFTNRQFIKTMPVKMRINHDCIGVWQEYRKKIARLTSSQAPRKHVFWRLPLCRHGTLAAATTRFNLSHPLKGIA
jgi:hypothetical protein